MGLQQSGDLLDSTSAALPQFHTAAPSFALIENVSNNLSLKEMI
jgi:hypothetical protein